MSTEHATPLTPLRRDPRPANENLRIGAQLLKGVPRLEESSARRHRVWLALPHSGPHAGRRRRWWKPASLVVASALAGAAASAALGGAYLGAPDREVSVGQASNRTVPVSDPGPRKVESPNPPERQRVEPEPLPENPTASSGLAPKASRAKSKPTRTEPVRAEEAELMLEIMSARERGDQGRASKLLAEYRRTHPRGILEEEALALSIESAQKKGDPQATTLAREYLKRFPAGRFRAQAERVVRGSSR